MERNIESLDPEDQSLWKITEQMMRVLTPPPPLVNQGGGITLSYSEKAESLTESLGAQCQLITVPTFLVFIEMCDVAIRPTFRPQPSNPS